MCSCRSPLVALPRSTNISQIWQGFIASANEIVMQFFVHRRAAEHDGRW